MGKSIGKTVKSFQQAAKEFEAELKKDPDSVSDELNEKPTAVSEEQKEDIKVSSLYERVEISLIKIHLIVFDSASDVYWPDRAIVPAVDLAQLEAGRYLTIN